MAETTNDHGPKYYRRGSIQVWDFVRDQELNFHLGNVIKYVCRAGHKFDDIDDLEKAIHYLKNELDNEKDIYFRASQGIPYPLRDSERSWEAKQITSEGSDS